MRLEKIPLFGAPLSPPSPWRGGISKISRGVAVSSEEWTWPKGVCPQKNAAIAISAGAERSPFRSERVPLNSRIYQRSFREFWQERKRDRGSSIRKRRANDFRIEIRWLEDHRAALAGVWPRNNSNGTDGPRMEQREMNREKTSGGWAGEMERRRKRKRMIVDGGGSRYQIESRLRRETPKRRWRISRRKKPVAGRDVLVGEHSVHHRYHTDWLLRLLTFYR